jgi:hypothetical protein
MEEFFLYDGIAAKVDFELLELAQAELLYQLDQAIEKDESLDGIPFCGCTDCYDRVVSGFWISWVLKTHRDGLIAIFDLDKAE